MVFNINCISGISKLNISSGTRTYRIPSPTRPLISRNPFQQPQNTEVSTTELPAPVDTSANEKGFYISFDNEQPKKPKPPLRVKRGSPKKEKVSLPANSTINNNNISNQSHMEQPEKIPRERHKQLARELEEQKRKAEEAKIEKQRVEKLEMEKEKAEQVRKEKEATALVIGSELTHLDPVREFFTSLYASKCFKFVRLTSTFVLFHYEIIYTFLSVHKYLEV